MIIIIAAVAENKALGKNNELVWHLPDDFKRFKQLTSGHHIIMGRKTFESFPKPLPNRTHIIITKQNKISENLNDKNCIVVDSIEKAIAMVPKDQDTFIIGGGEIYQLAMPFTDKLEITKVHAAFEADTFFPNIDEDQWELITEEFHKKDEKHNFGFTYQTYLKKNIPKNRMF